MPDRAHMMEVPEGGFPRAAWLDENLSRLLETLPLHEGWSAIARAERVLFPDPRILPLDPRCPTCGQETEDGRVSRSPDTETYLIHYDCGHVLELTRAELESRLGRSA